jgi:TolB-like protein
MTNRRLAAILAADVVGYSRLVSADESDALARLGALRRDIIEPNIAKHSGRLFKIMGDGFLAEFASAVQAVTCAIAIQTEAEKVASELEDTKKMRLRIGIHVGDVMVDGEDLMGDGVNIAARLESIAAPGGISISRAVHDQVRDRMAVAFDDKGEIALKNIARPVQVFALAGAKQPSTKLNEPTPTLALPDKPSIAVLPFQNMSGDPEQEYFADGMVEDIITALSRFKSLFVIARNSTFTYKGKTVDIKQVGRELGVRYVLEGSVRKSRGRVRITGQLIEAATGAHLWADKFDGGLEDVFELQDQITADVVGAVAPKLELAEIERVKRKPTVSLDSYDYYLRGMALFYTGKHEAAADCFQQAIQKNEDYADAYAMAAGCLVMKQGQQGVPLDVEERVKAVQLAQRAVSLGKDDALTLARAAHALVYLGQEYERGSDMIEQAVALNPNLSAVWFARGWISVICCDGERAIESFSQVLRLSPVDPRRSDSLNGLSWAHFLLGQYDDGCSWATKAMQNTANVIYLAAFVANAALAGRSLEARVAAKRLLEIEPAFRASHASNAFHVRQPDVQSKIIHALRQGGVSD